MGGQLCSEVEAASSIPAWQPGEIANGTAASLSFGGGSCTLTWGNRQLGASGPLPHHVYLQANPYGPVAWRWPEAITTPAGAPLQLPANINITDDDHVGGVKQVDSSQWCVGLTRGGNLEIWAGRLSGHRLAVALLNRGFEQAPVRGLPVSFSDCMPLYSAVDSRFGLADDCNLGAAWPHCWGEDGRPRRLAEGELNGDWGGQRSGRARPRGHTPGAYAQVKMLSHNVRSGAQINWPRLN